MIIDAHAQILEAVFRYDTNIGRLQKSYSGLTSTTVPPPPFTERTSDLNFIAHSIIKSEQSRTIYSDSSKKAINNHMRTHSVLFGKARQMPRAHTGNSYTWTEVDILESIRWVFMNRCTTSWGIKGLGSGVRRVYPSNGAVHSLECRYISKSGINLLYNPFDDHFIQGYNQAFTQDNCNRIIIETDFERLGERYRDVRSLAALYIEIGHALASLYYALRIRGISPLAPTLPCFEKGSEYFSSPVAHIAL